MKHLKQEFDKLTFKEALTYALAVIAMIAGLVMIFLGMYLPPKGEVHESVLTAFGIVCMFVASLLGISMHYSAQLEKFKESVVNRLDSFVPSGSKPPE